MKNPFQYGIFRKLSKRVPLLRVPIYDEALKFSLYYQLLLNKPDLKSGEEYSILVDSPRLDCSYMAYVHVDDLVDDLDILDTDSYSDLLAREQKEAKMVELRREIVRQQLACEVKPAEDTSTDDEESNTIDSDDDDSNLDGAGDTTPEGVQVEEWNEELSDTYVFGDKETRTPDINNIDVHNSVDSPEDPEFPFIEQDLTDQSNEKESNEPVMHLYVDLNSNYKHIDSSIDLFTNEKFTRNSHMGVLHEILHAVLSTEYSFVYYRNAFDELPSLITSLLEDEPKNSHIYTGKETNFYNWIRYSVQYGLDCSVYNNRYRLVKTVNNIYLLYSTWNNDDKEFIMLQKSTINEWSEIVIEDKQIKVIKK